MYGNEVSKYHPIKQENTGVSDCRKKIDAKHYGYEVFRTNFYYEN